MTCKRTLVKLQALGRLRQIAAATPVSPAFYQIVGVPAPEAPRGIERQCPAALRRAVIYEFGARCEYCEAVGTKDVGPDGKAWQVDRVDPALRGGTFSPDNVTLACKTCTNKKKLKPAPPGTRTLTALQKSRPGGDQLDPSPGGINQIPPPDQPDPPEGSVGSPGGIQLDPDLSDLNDLAGSGSAGAAPRHLDEPTENLKVITKIAHEVLDLLSETPDVTKDEVVEGIERRCDLFKIAYSPDLLDKAIDSAVFQRRRAGKSAVLPGAGGEAAFRLQQGGHGR